MEKPKGTDNILNEPNMDVCKAHRATKEAVCFTCFEHICFACAFHSHFDHRTAALDELDDELQKVANDLRTEIATVESEMELLRAQIKTQECTKYETHEDELHCLSKSVGEQLERQKHHLEALCKATALSGEYETKRYKKLFDEVETSVQFYYEAVNTALYDSHFSRLQYLNELMSKTDIEESKLDECRKYFMNNSLKNQIRPASLSAKVAILAKGPVLGAIKVTHRQLVIIRNYQGFKNYIHLACLSSEEPNVLFWEQSLEIAKDPPLIVINNNLIINPNGLKIIVAFERKLLAIEVHLNVEMHRLFFRSSSTIELNIPPTAHITSISEVLDEFCHGEVITTDSISDMFHIFDQNFHLLEKIKYNENYQALACIHENDVYKIAACVNSLSVSLLRGNIKSKDMTCVRKIENTYHYRKMFIQSIMFDGTFFSVLWVSKIEFIGDVIQWRVEAYDSDGAQFQVSEEGECKPDVKPVSISHLKHKTLLCFSNGSVKEFYTGGLAEYEFPDTGQLGNALAECPVAIWKEFTSMLKAALE